MYKSGTLQLLSKYVHLKKLCNEATYKDCILSYFLIQMLNIYYTFHLKVNFDQSTFQNAFIKQFSNFRAYLENVISDCKIGNNTCWPFSKRLKD